MTDKDNNSPAQSTPEQDNEEKKGRKWYFWPMIGLIAMVAVFLVGLIAAVLVALLADPDDAATWVGIIRDIFIIFLAMEGMLMGIALIALVLQLAALVNLLQNEITPIVDNLTKTTSTVRGTTEFMSQNVVEPVIKFSALAAGVSGLIREAIGIRQSLRSGNGQKPEKSKE